MYVCLMIVCMCADCMYAIVLDVCMYAEKKKEIYYPELLCLDWLFWGLLCVQASWFPSAGVI